MIKLLKHFSLIFVLSLVFLSLASCKFIGRDRGPKNPHICSYDDVNIISQVSCTTDGIVESECICGLSTVEVIPAHGHNFDQWQMIAMQDCSKFGKAVRICNECSYIQERVINKNSHNYTVEKETVNNLEIDHYICSDCGADFYMDPEVSLPIVDAPDSYIFDCQKNFSFVVISANNRDYVKNNLRIFNCYYDYPGNESNGLCDYELSYLGNNRWLVKPQKSIEEGATYRVEHSDGIYFEDYGFSQLIFSVEGKNGNKLVLSDNIIYLADLEAKSPGYYPYSLDLSTESGNYFLSLEKADELKNGDIICIGTATCFEDVINGSGNNTFGRILAITSLNDGRAMVLLGELTAEELFSAFKIYDHQINNFDELNLPMNVEDRLKTILFDNEDFASLVSLMYEESLSYISLRGLNTPYKDFEEYLNDIKILRESNTLLASDESGSYATASIQLKALIRIPLLFGDDNERIGSLNAELSLTLEIDALSFNLQMIDGNKNNVIGDGGIDLSFRVTEKNSSELRLDIYSSAEYSADSTPYVFEVDTRKYHFANCSHIAKETADKQTTVSVYSLLGVISESVTVNECEFCRPASSMKQDICVLDESSGIFHNTKCKSCFSTNPANLLFTEIGSAMLSSMGYVPCSVCGGNSDSIGMFESNILSRIANKDFGEYVNSVIESVIDSDGIRHKLYVGAFSTTLCGIDREISILSVNLNFRLENTTHYSYKIQRESTYGMISTAKGTQGFNSYFNEEIQVNGFISPAFGDNLLNFDSTVSLLIAGFSPVTTE